MKQELLQLPLLVHPSFSAQIVLYTDASSTDIGAVLQQEVNGTLPPVQFFSRKLIPVETRYSTFDQELPAIYEAIKQFLHLKGRHFTVYTDHKPLVYALSSRSDTYSPRITWHLLYIIHSAGPTLDRLCLGVTRCPLHPPPKTLRWPIQGRSASSQILHHRREWPPRHRLSQQTEACPLL